MNSEDWTEILKIFVRLNCWFLKRDLKVVNVTGWMNFLLLNSLELFVCWRIMFCSLLLIDAWAKRKAKSSEEKKFDEAEIFSGKEINEEMWIVPKFPGCWTERFFIFLVGVRRTGQLREVPGFEWFERSRCRVCPLQDHGARCQLNEPGLPSHGGVW